MIIIDYKDRRPIYEQVVEKLQELILREILEPDSQMPSVRSLAMELSINPNTIQRAYAELERRGIIYTVKGKGSFVAAGSRIREQKEQEIWDRLFKLVEEGIRLGLTREQFLDRLGRFFERGGMEA